MIEKINKKMAEHIEAILRKPIITNEEYMILCGYLSKLEAEKSKAEFEADSEARDERFRTLLGALWGGGLSNA